MKIRVKQTINLATRAPFTEFRSILLINNLLEPRDYI